LCAGPLRRACAPGAFAVGINALTDSICASPQSYGGRGEMGGEARG
jgi:hypothetical protein